MFEKLSSWLNSYLIKLIKDNIKILGIVLCLFPVFGSSLVVSTAFITKEQHILFEYVEPLKVCGNFKGLHQGFGYHKPFEKNIYLDFLSEYKATLKPTDYFELKGYDLCRVEYAITIGNIGEASMDDIHIQFDTQVLALVFPDANPYRHIYTRLENISAVEPRAFDPSVHQEAQNYNINRLDAGAMITFHFNGWFVKGVEPLVYEDFVKSITVNQGIAEPGSPKATAFARFFSNLI